MSKIFSKLKVILSDLHAGAPGSILTVLDPNDFSPIAHQMSVATQAFGKAMNATLAAIPQSSKPDLVLLGDALDFSLAQPAVSAQVLSSFLGRGGMDVGAQYDAIQFVPGNHDHELWTAERYGATMAGEHNPIHPDYWAHTSPAFTSPNKMGTTTTLNRILARSGHAAPIATYYPNMGLLPSTPAECPRRATMLHHGHFIEDAYKMMTRLLATLLDKKMPPMTAENLETVNGSWIDFAWSTVGDDGSLGVEIGFGERLMVTGGAAHAFQDHLASMLIKEARTLLPIPQTDDTARWMKFAARATVDSMIGAYSQGERYDYTQTLSQSSQAGLAAYIQHVVSAQIKTELKAEEVPEQLSFIFGHTHKPFADRIVVEGYSRPVSVYNTGGWVVDTALLSTVEGAGVCFVDEAGHTAMIRIYQMGPNGSLLHAQVISSDPLPDAENPLFVALSAAVEKEQAAWANFSVQALRDIMIKQDMFLTMGERAETQYLGKGGWR